MRLTEPPTNAANGRPATAPAIRTRILLCGLTGAGLGVLALVGWVTGLRVLASLGTGYVAMFPPSAVAVVLLGLSFALLGAPGASQRMAKAAAVLALLVLLWGYLYLISYFTGLYLTPEKYLVSPTQWGTEDAPLQESPISAACFFLLGAGVFLLVVHKAKRPAGPMSSWDVALGESSEPFLPGGWAAASASVVALVNLIAALGYSYGAPVLYGSFIAPTALPTSLAFLCLSTALILAAGPHHWPLRPLVGSSARAVLLRNFVPLIAIATLVGGALHAQLIKHIDISPVYLSALWALLFSVIVSFLVSEIAQEIGGSLDRAEAEIAKLNQDLEHRLAELAETNRRLVQQSEENEMFVYSVSHDLRSPLVNLQGFSKELSLVCEDFRGIMKDSALPAEVQKRGTELVDNEMGQSIRFIQTAVMRLAGIIDSLLRLSRAGRVELRCSQADLNAIMARVVESLQNTISERGAKVMVKPLPSVWGDTTVLEQIFANLIGNALNYLDPARPGVIEVGVREPPADGGHVTYYVKDNGLGIPQAYHQKVFQAFQRFHAERAKGEGMGLASVRRLVDRHGGKIWFESAAGEGTTFFVSLPVRPIAPSLSSFSLGEKGSPAQANGSKGHDLREVSHSHGGR